MDILLRLFKVLTFVAALAASLYLWGVNSSLGHAIEVHERSMQRQTAAISGTLERYKLLRRYGVPAHYLDITIEACQDHDLDVDFILRMMYVESRFDTNAKSNKHAYGLMQLQYATAREMDPELQSYWQLFDPERNIRLGVKYFRGLLDKYGSYKLAAIAYNRGPGRLDRELLAGIMHDWYYNKVEDVGSRF